MKKLQLVKREVQAGLVICGRYVTLFWTSNTEFPDKKILFLTRNLDFCANLPITKPQITRYCFSSFYFEPEEVLLHRSCCFP